MFKLKFTKIHFPTALGLFILLAGVGVAIFLIKTRTSPTRIGADESLVPNQVRITNVTDTGFSVSFVTAKATTGLVKYGTEENSLKQTALDDRDQLSGEAGAFEVHHVTVKNLKSSSKYYFKIESGGKQFDNQGRAFEVTTGATLGDPPAADPVYGTILSPTGTPVEGVVVYLNVPNGAPLSALARTNGNWALSLSTARSADLGSYLTYDTQAMIVNILVQGGKQGTAPAITTTANDSPVPDITLGQSHDFRSESGDSEILDTQGDVDLGDSSGFNLDLMATGSSTATDSGEVTLENPSYEGEIINATQPAFIGTGPPGKVLAVEINSETTYTGSATVDENGEWEFTPPEGLEVGEHTITISYIDEGGDEQTLVRNFVVAAAGESEVPAITATPSGDTATDTARTSMPSTESGVPDAGTGEVTVLIVLAGVGLVIGGLRLKNIV